METEQSRAQKYSSLKNRIFFFHILLSIVLLAVLQLSGVSAWLKSMVYGLTNNFFLGVAIYATYLGIILYIIADIPLGFYQGYILEHRFKLSNQKLSAWIKDELKRVLISYVIFLLFVLVLYFFLRKFPHTWWMWIAAAWILFEIVLTKLVPVLIIPLFYKYTDLQNRELKEKLIRLAQSCGVKILNVFKLDLSAKTKKANAALAGIGNTRRILLGDTLLNNYSDEEIEVVMAHELAHHKFKHIARTLFFTGVCTVTGFYMISTMLDSAINFLGLRNIYDVAAFPSIILALTLFSSLIMPLVNGYSRSLERQADVFAIKITKLPHAFISCMNKLARQNLSNISPSRFIEIMLYDHPPISKRVEMAHGLIKKGL